MNLNARLLLLTCLTTIIFMHCFGQVPAGKFAQVDSFARSVKYKGDTKKLTDELTLPYKDNQLLKVRSIFVWIAENIAYDYEFVNRGKEIKTPDCDQGAVCEQRWIDWEKHYLENVIKKKKAICDGYARLFQQMCTFSGIRNEIVSGYTKTRPYQIGTYFGANHAWNAIMMDSVYYFFDATWAAGGCLEDEETEKLLSFEKQFNEYYWMTSFHDLSRDHFPKEGRWVMEANFTKDKFSNNPYFAPWALDKIKLISPLTGVLEVNKGDTVKFVVDYAEKVEAVQINTNAERSPAMWTLQKSGKKGLVPVTDTNAFQKQRYIAATRDGKQYSFQYVITDSNIYYLDVLFNYRRVLRFKVKFIEPNL